MSKKQHYNYMVLLILALIFAFPGVAAYLFYRHPQWLTGYPLNKGTLLNPPEYLNLARLDNQPKWRLILWNPGDCTNKCLAQIDKLARVRLALGRRLLSVDEVIVLNKQSQYLPELNKQLEAQDIHLLLISDEQQAKQSSFNQKARIFIANPNNYLVLAYELKTKPADIFHDIQQLLNTSGKSHV